MHRDITQVVIHSIVWGTSFKKSFKLCSWLNLHKGLFSSLIFRVCRLASKGHYQANPFSAIKNMGDQITNTQFFLRAQTIGPPFK